MWIDMSLEALQVGNVWGRHVKDMVWTSIITWIARSHLDHFIKNCTLHAEEHLAREGMFYQEMLWNFDGWVISLRGLVL